MIDIETTGSQDDARILQIAAVAFELNGKVQEPHEILRDAERWYDVSVIYPDLGRQPTVDRSNIEFWQQPAQQVAYDLLARRPAVVVQDALEGLGAFLLRWLGKRGGVWAKPPSFDLRILRGHYQIYGEPDLALPWSGAQEYDLRTLLWGAKKVQGAHFRVPDMSGAGLTAHFALHDAVRQAVVAQAAFRALGLHVAESKPAD